MQGEGASDDEHEGGPEEDREGGGGGERTLQKVGWPLVTLKK